MWWKYTQSIKTIEIPGRKIIHFSRTIWPRLICVFWLNITILLYYHWSTLATVNWIFAELPTDAESRTISSDLPLIRKMHQKIVNATNCISILQVKHSETLSNIQKKIAPPSSIVSWESNASLREEKWHSSHTILTFFHKINLIRTLMQFMQNMSVSTSFFAIRPEWCQLQH